MSFSNSNIFVIVSPHYLIVTATTNCQ